MGEAAASAVQVLAEDPLAQIVLAGTPTETHRQVITIFVRRILQLTRDIEIITTSVRDNIDPRNLVKNVIDDPFVFSMLKQAESLARELGSEMASAPYWLKDTEEKISAAEQAAAAADLPIRMIRCMKEAYVSSGSDKLEDLAEIVDDISTVLPALVTVNPVLGLYGKFMVESIKSIARSAKIIEEATKRKNEAIREAGKALGSSDVTEYLEETEHPMDEKLEELETIIRELEQKIDHELAVQPEYMLD